MAAYVLTHHPKVAMTFISNEIAAMERAGWRVVPIALNSPEPDDLKSDWARRESERTVYPDRFSRLALAKRLGQHLVRHPVAIGRLLARVARSAGHDTSLLVTRFGHLLYATAVADEISQQDARHVHAHFGLSPASVAWFTSELTATTAPAQCSWSFTIHGFHDFVDERLARLDLKAAAANFVVFISDFTRSQCQFKRCVSQLRRNLYPLRELLGSLHREHAHFFAPEIQLYLRDVYDHTVHIIESLEDRRELATGLLDVHLTTVSHRVNLEVRMQTVVATIFMPATLIAGIFGMNFHQMPWLERPGGFYYATGLMVMIACIMLVLFWRRR